MIKASLWLEAFGRQAFPFALNFLWQSTLVIAVAAGTAYLLRQQRAADRRAVWLTALFACLLLPLGSTLFHHYGVVHPVLPQLDLHNVSHRWSQMRLVRVAYEPTAPAPASDDEIATVTSPPRQEPWIHPEAVLRNLRGHGEPSAPLPQSPAVVIDLVYVIPGLLYAIGIGVFLIRFLSGASWLGWVRLGSKPASHPDIPHIMAAVCRTLKMRRAPRVKTSHHVNSPAIFGLIFPTIIIPQSLEHSLTTTQLRQILAHELTHVRAGDYAYGMLWRIAQVGLFYQPLLRMVIDELRKEAEFLADDVAVTLSRRAGESPGSYAELLVAMAERNQPSYAERFAATALVSPPSLLARRVEAILAHGRRSNPLLTPSRRLCYHLGGLLMLTVMSTTSIVTPSSSAGHSYPEQSGLSPRPMAPPPSHMRDPFHFEVDAVWPLPADAATADASHERGMVYDQALERLTIVGDGRVAQYTRDSPQEAWQPVSPPLSLNEPVHAVALIEPALAGQALPGSEWARDGALALSPVEGREVWFMPRRLEDVGVTTWMRVPAPAPEHGGQVVGLASVSGARIPGELARITSAAQPGQIDMLHLRAGDQPRFERRISSFSWDLRHALDEAAPPSLTGVALDPFDETLYVVDFGAPMSSTAPGSRVQAFTYMADYRPSPVSGQFHRRMWSGLIAEQLARRMEQPAASMRMEDIYFSRTGDRLYLLCRGAEDDGGGFVAVLRRPRLTLRLPARELVVGESMRVEIEPTVPTDPDMAIRLISSAPDRLRTSLSEPAGGPGHHGTLHALHPGDVVVSVIAPDMPGESLRLRILPSRTR